MVLYRWSKDHNNKQPKERVIIMKINGLKKAVGDYQSLNREGGFSPWYGELMYDTETGEIWTDEFYSIGHNTWREYHSKTIVNLGEMMGEKDIAVNMKNVKEFIATHFN